MSIIRDVNKIPYYRDFYQGQGTVVQGTWVWSSDLNQTYFASVTEEANGYYVNNSNQDLDEYKWSNIFLTKGGYKITILTLKHINRGIAEVLLGITSLGTKNCYAASEIYNQFWEIVFTLTNDITADMRFRVNGKDASSTGYYANFSQFHIEKTG